MASSISLPKGSLAASIFMQLSEVLPYSPTTERLGVCLSWLLGVPRGYAACRRLCGPLLLISPWDFSSFNAFLSLFLSLSVHPCLAWWPGPAMPCLLPTSEASFLLKEHMKQRHSQPALPLEGHEYCARMGSFWLLHPPTVLPDTSLPAPLPASLPAPGTSHPLLSPFGECLPQEAAHNTESSPSKHSSRRLLQAVRSTRVDRLATATHVCF